MQRTIFILVFILCLGTITASAQNREDRVVRRYDGKEIYQDSQGDIHWQTIEHKVWVTEYRTGGVFGIGSRTVPAHYEIRTERVKIYHDRNYGNNNYDKKGWEGKHPHGMPPGQRKKMRNSQYRTVNGGYYQNDNRRDNDDDRYENDRRYSKKKSKGHDRDDD